MSDELIVNGQQMHLLGDDEWGAAVRDGEWRDLPVYHALTKPVVEAMSRFARAHRDAFRIALCRDGPHAKTWTTMHLLVTSEGWQRVHVERVRCDACGANQMIANPTVPDLYFGVKNWQELMKRATAYGSLGCVRCNERLPRFAIWVEALNDE